MPGEAAVHLIDDDDGVRASLAFVLTCVGLRVENYASAEAFLEVAPALRSGCVIADIRLPGASGLDVIRALREMGSALPVIAISGHAGDGIAAAARQAGAVAFLEKPFSDDAVLGEVEQALRRGDPTPQRISR